MDSRGEGIMDFSFLSSNMGIRRACMCASATSCARAGGGICKLARVAGGGWAVDGWCEGVKRLPSPYRIGGKGRRPPGSAANYAPRCFCRRGT
ncbi:hypothetical protein Trydic_g7169 [Trypoxylus dichotomus]